MKIFGKLWLPEGEGPFPVVILSSGQSALYTTTEKHAKKFADEGIAGVAFDFTGTGGALPEYFERAAQTFSFVQVEKVDGADHFFTGISSDKMIERTIEYLHQNIG